MSYLRGCAIIWGLLACLGCKSSQLCYCAPAQPQITANIGSPANVATANVAKPSLTSATVVPVAFQEPIRQPDNMPSPSDERVATDVLSRVWLQAEIEARNPSLEAMLAAAQAAAQLYPQRVALDDPVLMGMIAPESVGADETETAYAFQLNQKIPWHGKRPLRGAVAAADADAAFQDAEDTRLQVRLAADLAYFDYFLVARLQDINAANSRLMQELRDTAQTRYRTGAVTQQDVLQADLELADLSRRELELNRMRDVAIARINTLLRRWPNAPLPLPPANLDSPSPPADTELLWQSALQERPDLGALAWRVQSAEASLELAYKNYCPDFDLFTRYDTFWQPSSTQGPLRAQIGVATNLPVYRQKLHAAVCEAQFRLQQRRAEFEQKTLEIQYEVISAAKQVEESRQTIELFDKRLVPAAEQNVAAVRANYLFAKATFLDLAQAQRQLISISERQLEAAIAYHRRLAELDRAVGIHSLSAQRDGNQQLE